MGYSCDVPECEESLCSPVCGDGVRTPDEGCDDGNSGSGDGCAGCTVECGYYCNLAEPNACTTDCGDGILAGDETCDDDNKANQDGCNAICGVEDGFACTSDPCSTSTCGPICGDGKLIGGEACDDGDTVSDDGC